MFKQQTRLITKTFHYLCNIVALSLGREKFRMRSCIPIETRVAITLSCLGSDNTLQTCGEMYGVVESTTSIIAKDFCVVIRKQLKPFVIERLTSSSIRRMTYEFEKLQGVSFFLG
jgi:hypothetical protein